MPERPKGVVCKTIIRRFESDPHLQLRCLRLAVQDTGLSRRKSRVRIPQASPTCMYLCTRVSFVQQLASNLHPTCIKLKTNLHQDSLFPVTKYNSFVKMRLFCYFDKMSLIISFNSYMESKTGRSSARLLSGACRKASGSRPVLSAKLHLKIKYIDDIHALTISCSSCPEQIKDRRYRNWLIVLELQQLLLYRL